MGPDVAGLRSLRCEVGGLRTEVWSVRSAGTPMMVCQKYTAV